MNILNILKFIDRHLEGLHEAQLRLCLDKSFVTSTSYFIRIKEYIICHHSMIYKSILIHQEKEFVDFYIIQHFIFMLYT